MTKTVFAAIYLLFAQSIFADGIIENLSQYLKNCPECIDELGWITVSKEKLLNNNMNFDINCQYKIIYNDDIVAYPIFITEWSMTFKSFIKERLMKIIYGSKTQVWQCIDGDIKIRKDVSTTWKVNAIKQLSSESMIFIKRKRTEKLRKQVFSLVNDLNITNTSSEININQLLNLII